MILYGGFEILKAASTEKVPARSVAGNRPEISRLAGLDERTLPCESTPTQHTTVCTTQHRARLTPRLVGARGAAEWTAIGARDTGRVRTTAAAERPGRRPTTEARRGGRRSSRRRLRDELDEWWSVGDARRGAARCHTDTAVLDSVHRCSRGDEVPSSGDGALSSHTRAGHQVSIGRPVAVVQPHAPGDSESGVRTAVAPRVGEIQLLVE